MKLHFERHGSDRVQNGEKLSELLSDRLNQAGTSRTKARELRRYRQVYPIYPKIRESLTPETNIRHISGGESGSGEGNY